MVKNSDNIQLMVQISIMYYRYEMTQQEIAKKLGLTRQTVSKLLQESKRNNIVNIQIINPLNDIEDMGEQLKSIYSLKNAIVVPSDFEDGKLIRSVLSQKAAVYIEELLRRNEYSNIAFSWGRTVYEIIDQLPIMENENLTAIPLVGASGKTAPYYMINEMVRVAAHRLSASPIYAYIPVHPESEEDADLFKKTSTYRNMQSLWDNIGLGVMGIGVNLTEENSIRIGYPGENIKEGVVGDICTNYFDAEGNFVQNNDIICATAENLRKAKTVLAVSGGLNKASAIIGALKSGIVTDLIIDELTAKKILNR